MPDVSIAPTTNRQTWSSFDYLWSDGITLPAGRAMLGGSRTVGITALYAVASGNGGSRSIRLRLGSCRTSEFVVGSASEAKDTGWRGVETVWYVEGGTARFSIDDVEGPLWFGRGGGGTVYSGNTLGGSPGASWAGTLGGAYRYIEAPTSPEITTAYSYPSDLTKMNVEWKAPSSDGGTPITFYRVWYWKDGEAVRAHYKDQIGTARIQNIDVEPGFTYNIQVSAANKVTEQEDTVGFAGAIVRKFISSAGKVWNGTAWVPAAVKVWDGDSWEVGVVKVWDGDSWEQGK